jgi:pyruvate formate lyase activating enzyme
MRCIGVARCGKCLTACSQHGITPGVTAKHAVTQEDIQHIRINRSICEDCGDCASVCYSKALYVCGTDYTVAELLKRLVKDIPFYEQSGGGVTISGGEPLCQPEFTLEILKGIKALGIHTALDTTGYAAHDIIKSVLPYTDLFLYDLKHMDNEQHRIVTGVPNDLILENAQWIAGAGGKMQIRIPVIPEFNDSADCIRETGEFCKSLGDAVTLVQLLPYHNLGVMKYQRLDDSKIILEATPPSEARIDALKMLLEGLGLPVTVH